MKTSESQVEKSAETQTVTEIWSGDEIRSLRLRLGWSAADFARRFGCLSDQIMNWEKGAAQPSSEDRLQLMKLSIYVDSYSEQMQRAPIAEEVLRSGGFEQVHNDLLISYLKN